MKLLRATIADAEKLHKMQVEAFADLYAKYQDTETSPATETVDDVEMKLMQRVTYFYFIQESGEIVGAIRVIDEKEDGKPKYIAPIFVMPEHRNRGIAQKAIGLVEEIHGRTGWRLDTILQEEGLCYLYEKLGYSGTGKTEVVNDKMTLVFYSKE